MGLFFFLYSSQFSAASPPRFNQMMPGRNNPTGYSPHPAAGKPWLSPPATCSTTRNPSLARAWGQGQGQGAWSLSETITLWARTSWPLEGQPRLWWAQWGEVLWGLQCRWQVDHNWGKTNTSSSTQWPPGHSTDRRVRYKRREGKKESHEMTIYCKL